MKKLVIFILLIVILISCSTSPEALATQAAGVWTPTSEATMIPTKTIIPSPTPTPVFPIGELIHFSRNENFDYDWFLYIPLSVERSKKTHIFLSGVHGNIHTPNYDEIVSESKKIARGRIVWAKNLESILLVPVVPKYYDYQPYDFDLPSFDETTGPFYQRPDFEINNIIDYLLSELQSNGYKVDSKILIEGFSSGGMFTQRYALLNPNRVQAIAAGHCGGTFILPESVYEDTPINWPVGINNYTTLTGEEFNKEAYQKIKQFIFIGKEDDNTTLILNNSRSLWESQSQINFVHNHFGDSSYEILKNQIKYLQEIGYENIFFKAYDGYGHEYSGEMAKDATDFLIENK